MTDDYAPDEIEEHYTVEILCDNAVHSEPALVGVFLFDPAGWQLLDRDGLEEHGYFDAADGENPLKGVQKTERLLWGDDYLPKGQFPPRGDHGGKHTRLKYKFQCSCGWCVPSKYPDRVHSVLDTLARHGRENITLKALAARLRSTSDRSRPKT
jgi:hypothetical protein